MHALNSASSDQFVIIILIELDLEEKFEILYKPISNPEFKVKSAVHRWCFFAISLLAHLVSFASSTPLTILYEC